MSRVIFMRVRDSSPFSVFLPPVSFFLSFSLSHVPSWLNALHAQMHRNAILRRDYYRRYIARIPKHGSLNIYSEEPHTCMVVIVMRDCEKYGYYLRKRYLLETV